MRISQEQVVHAHVHHIHTAHSPYSCLIHIRRLTAESHDVIYTIHGKKNLKMPIAGGFSLWGQI